MAGFLVMKRRPESGSEPLVLANAIDLSQFDYQKKEEAKEFVVSVGRSVVKATMPGQTQSCKSEAYHIYCYNRDGLCAVAFVDDQYPEIHVFSFLEKILDDYENSFGDSWRSLNVDLNQPWPYLDQALISLQEHSQMEGIVDGDDNQRNGNKTVAPEEGGDQIGEKPVMQVQDTDVPGSEEMEHHVSLILEKIEKFTEQVSEVLEAGKQLFKELSNNFEDGVVRIHQQQMDLWQEEIKELRLLDASNEEALQCLHNAQYLLQNFNAAAMEEA